MTSHTQPDNAGARAIVQGYRSIDALLPSHWSQDSVVANGIRHHYYRTGGDKPPVVLLHGFLDGALTWLRTARALEPDYDVILLDTRGHGRSDGIATGFSQALLTEDAAGVIRALHLSAPRLVGHSQGGATAIHMAAAYPELVRAFVVEGWGDDMSPDVESQADDTHVNTDFTNSPGYQAWFNGFVSWVEQLKTQTHAERMVSALSQLPPGAPVLPEDEYVPWVDNCAHLDLALVRQSMTMWSQVGTGKREMVEALRRVNCPVLIMKSSFFPQPGGQPEVQEEASDRPNIKIVRFEHTGHLIHRDRFDLFIALVQGFFKEQDQLDE